MTFIVTFIALMIERFFDWSHLRHWSWYSALERTLAQKLAGTSPYITLALTIVPLLLMITIIQVILTGALYGLLNLIFQLVILVYCIGPRNLWADGFACASAVPNDFCKNYFSIDTMDNSQQLHKQLLDKLFIEANRRLFAVIFWFVILGPLGAVLYRTVTISAQEKAVKEPAALEVSLKARLIETILDWLPIRIFTFIFALGGHFSQVIAYWRKNFKLALADNEILLTQCGEAALGGGEEIAQDGSAEKNAIGLIDRAFIIVLVLVAIGVLLL
jgi:AmpE protein